MSTRSDMRRIAVIGAVLATTVAVGSPAYAAGEIQDGSANVGRVNVTSGETTTSSGDLALCDVDPQTPTPSSGTEPAKTYGSIAKFGKGTTECKKVGDDNVVKMSGTKFELTALKQYGYTKITRVSTYSAECTSTPTGTSGKFSLGGVSGLEIPNPMPAGHMIPLKNNKGELLARVFFNEVTKDQGAIRLNVMRVAFPPAGVTPLRGSIIVGSVECRPSF
ncbi:hypothetical protein NLX83_03455 [Allokutzneria sp. A3M-2-11 16]|uniref:hypothetical protein n=1 Tax=Allokutzneria sp. A3M-2-11 16 TaxID=2962043 RepID=UPI0020B749F2|nr:hypothetical protein [Allokutzneria sp. A3M-2-11 16]MCP3798307.1 hypothetical protein [Allokutzneria sp. A3M-2-11 16]